MIWLNAIKSLTQFWDAEQNNRISKQDKTVNFETVYNRRLVKTKIADSISG